MPNIDLDERLIRVLEHRDFFDPDEPENVTVADDDIVLDVLILARVKRPESVGTSESALVIISQNETDNLMIAGMLHQAVVIQDQDGYERREAEE